MLVLTRKKGERVLIGDDIVVTVIDVRGDGVRIGFDAPRGVKIQRAEVIRAVTEANTEAAATSPEQADVLVGLLAASRRTAPAASASRPAPAASAPHPASAASTEAPPAPGPVAPDAAPVPPAPRGTSAAAPKPTPPRSR